MRTWRQQELRIFLRETEGHPLHPLWVLAATTGMRRSELLGLRWDDVDLVKSTVTVRGTVVPGLDGYELVDAQKSPTSARTIHLDGRTVALLRRYREGEQALEAEVESTSGNQFLVFMRADGSWWNPPAISLAFRRAVEGAGVPRIRFHDLRHTHATLLLKAGVNPKVVSERLGHSSVTFTLDTYAHVIPGMQPEAAELFSDLVFGSAAHANHNAGEEIL